MLAVRELVGGVSTVEGGLGAKRFLLAFSDKVKSARARLQAFVGVSGGVLS